ncbi:hypothetical protein [Candidatus Protofrankia californiensis]|uniref:hypothetical protein n=1 Tax=Candidatus Protofrankia californiensis TaxID=1839754 RepID=UPI00104108D7|nr:hypothetical protein [Candidatus Protofrankia californiensis]
MTPYLNKRLQIAQQAAADLADDHPGAQIWLVGAVAEHLAHAHSDIDLLLIVPTGPLPPLHSRLMDGVRVDPTTVTSDTVGRLRSLLGSFAVTREDIEVFRTVRARLADLTLLRTALAFSDGAFAPVLSAAERTGYLRWALADRAEAAASLAEDLVGLAEAALHPHADVVWDRLAVTLAAAEAVAAGAPLLGAKWLPSLLTRAEHTATGHRRIPSLPTPHWPDAASPWFAPAQVRLANALLSCWPTEAAPDPSWQKDLSGFGWLPQRYADGWFLRRGDVRVPLSDGQLIAWRDAAAKQPHP